MRQVGFIGLGIMGKPMALNLLKKGFGLVILSSRASEAVEELRQKGAATMVSPRLVAEKSDVVVTCLPDSTDVEEVYIGPRGVMEGARPGMIFVDMSTISPTVAMKLASEAEKRGVKMLDAPVSGGQKGAIEGTLSIMVGGDAEALAGCMDVLQAMGKTIVHIGASGAGQYAKAANQIILATTWQGIAEGMVLACKAGVDPAKVLEALIGGAARCWALEVRMPLVLEGRFAPGFMAKLQYKDLGIALQEGRRLGVPLPVTAIVNEFYKTIVQTGMGELDTSALVRLTERLAGVEIRRGRQGA